jgi:hypothetical protein
LFMSSVQILIFPDSHGFHHLISRGLFDFF